MPRASDKRAALRKVIEIGYAAADRQHARVRNFRNITIVSAATITLFLALFVIVLLFLLVQNRIDRRDPKLAVASADAQPELTFGPVLRPGGATA